MLKHSPIPTEPDIHPSRAVKRVAQSRKAKRVAKRRRVRISAILIAISVLIPAFVLGAYYISLPVSALDAAKMFPASTTDLRTFTPMNIQAQPPASVLESLSERAAEESNKDTTAVGYAGSFFASISKFAEFKKAHDWVGASFAQGIWDGGSATIYSLSNANEAKDFMESPECMESIFKDTCGEGNYLIKSNWLIIGTQESLGFYAEDFKTTLADNPEFAVQTEDILENSFAAAWTASENITSFMPLNLSSSFPTKAKASVALIPTQTGISIKGSLFKADSSNAMFGKEPISDSIKKTPGNTVMAISVGQAYQDVKDMTENPESFISKDPSWQALRKALESYGTTVPEDLQPLLGETTTFSLNEGTVGNKVAGTLRVDGGKIEKATEILSNAALKNDDIKKMYMLKQDGNNLVIESHSPVAGGSLSDNPLFVKLVGNTDKSVAVAFIDFDNTRSLLNSEYVKPESSYDKGIMGINFSKHDDKTINFALNWEMTKPEPNK